MQLKGGKKLRNLKSNAKKKNSNVSSGIFSSRAGHLTTVSTVTTVCSLRRPYPASLTSYRGEGETGTSCKK